MDRVPLPVDEALPRLVEALRDRGAAVLRAPAGAGKTTRVPPAILDAGLAGAGQVVVVEPRRVAARAAARRIAEERGAEVGREVGWHVRFDRRAGRGTRILAVTEGILLRRLQDDPFLDGVGAVVLDEFHERSLASDLILALAHRVRDDARPDLRIVVMSATLDPSPVAEYLDAATVASEGFLHPVEVRHLERPDPRRIEDLVADGVRRAIAATSGDVLAFLPGLGEIRRTAERLAGGGGPLPVDVLELHGELAPERQDHALRAGPRRRVVLATNVAETSVTVEGVTAVVDSGFARVLRHDPVVGMDRLVLQRIARSSVAQRTGRAGRVAPGICFRTWTVNEERSFPERLEPEVRRVDLAGAALELLAWGETDLAAFPWFEAPEPARLSSALDLLTRLGAIDDGRITATGREMVRLGVHPREARLLVEGARLGRPERAALAAALLTERDPIRVETRPRGAVHHSESDVLDRIDALEAFERDGRRSFAFGDLHPGGADFVLRARDQLLRSREDAAGGPRTGADEAVLRAVFAAYPDRLARRRASGDRRAVLVSGRGVRLAEESAVADAELFVCVDVDSGTGPDALVRRASGVRREWLPAERVRTSVDVEFDESAERVTAVRRTRFDELVLGEAPAPLPDDGRVGSLLEEAAARRLDRALDTGSEALAALRSRVEFLRREMPDLGLPALDDAALRAVLPDLCAGRRSFAELRAAPVADLLRARMDRRHAAALDRETPERIDVPSGRRAPLRYDPRRPPVLSLRIQEVFGWADTPRVAGGRVRIVLELLAPNGRPQQTTDDLRSFWTNVYPDLRREMSRRYPRHSWPEDPWTARAERRPARKRSTR